MLSVFGVDQPLASSHTQLCYSRPSLHSQYCLSRRELIMVGFKFSFLRYDGVYIIERWIVELSLIAYSLGESLEVLVHN